MATKNYYVCINKDNGQTLYNRVMATWNDGVGRRDGSTVWKFSARKAPEENKTIQRAIEYLAKFGFTNLEFELRSEEVPDKPAKQSAKKAETKAAAEEKPAEANAEQASNEASNEPANAEGEATPTDVASEGDEISEALEKAI